MKIVGVGAGPGMLTQEALEVIREASVIYGSHRALELASDYIPSTCVVQEITDFKCLKDLSGDIVVLSTGDPMLAGLGYIGGEIIPGISSMQVAFARLGLPLARAIVVVAHGRNHQEAVAKTVEGVGLGKLVFIIADPDFDVNSMSFEVANIAPLCSVAICERLGYPNERIVTGSVNAPPQVKEDLYVLVVGNFEI